MDLQERQTRALLHGHVTGPDLRRFRLRRVERRSERTTAATGALARIAYVERLLYGIRYHAEAEPHITLKDPALCVSCEKPCLWVCPAGVCRAERGGVRVAHENYLECGACRFACPLENVRWRNPTGGIGIAYRRG